MQKLKVILSALLGVFIVCETQAQWGVVVQHAGFLGKAAVGPSYDFRTNHHFTWLLGTYEIGEEEFYQTSVVYRYSPWQERLAGYCWRPIQFGLFGTYALNTERFFFKSPDVYPEDKYYEQNVVRGGVEFGTDISHDVLPVTLGIHVRWLDIGMIALFNNTKRDQQYYFSSGISLQYKF